MGTDADSTERIEAALTEVPASGGRPVDDWSVEGPDDDPDATPEIVPTTEVPRLAAASVVVPAAPRPVDPRPLGDHRTASTPPTEPSVTAWGDHVSPIPAGSRGPGLRPLGRRPRVRRVTRVLRHIDPWSTFKVALLFSAVGYLVALTSGVLLWRVADSTGTIANVERWFTQFGWETFEFDGGEIFHNAWIIGLFGAVALTGAFVLVATLFNLVSDIVGGVRLTVLEEEVVERTNSSARRYLVRRTPGAVADPGSVPDEDWVVDDPADADAPVDAATAEDWSVADGPDESDTDVVPGPAAPKASPRPVEDRQRRR